LDRKFQSGGRILGNVIAFKKSSRCFIEDPNLGTLILDKVYKIDAQTEAVELLLLLLFVEVSLDP
jgi:hypothetical protein